MDTFTVTHRGYLQAYCAKSGTQARLMAESLKKQLDKLLDDAPRGRLAEVVQHDKPVDFGWVRA